MSDRGTLLNINSAIGRIILWLWQKISLIGPSVARLRKVRKNPHLDSVYLLTKHNLICQIMPGNIREDMARNPSEDCE